MPKGKTPELEELRKQKISATLNKLYEDPTERAKHASWNNRKHTPEELAKMGLPGASNPMWNTGAGANKEYIKEQYLAGKSCSDLATELGVAYQTIAFHIHNLGIMRTKAEAIVLGGMQGKFARFGEDNHWWKGGIYPNPYPEEFNEELKERIRERDGRRCQRCGTPEYECRRALDIHHKDGNKFNNSDDNLTSLCSSCHAIIELELGKYIYRDEATGRVQAR